MGGTCLASFTLAEVLIVLGIIGLIADMTIPTLHQNITEKVTMNKLKKAYSTYDSAFKLAIIENGEPEGWGLTDRYTDKAGAGVLLNILSKYLKISKNCGYESGCFYSGSYKYLNGDNWYVIDAEDIAVKIILADSSNAAFESWSQNCSRVIGTSKALSKVCAKLFVDINGKNSPNVAGKDLFAFWITKYGLVPTGTQEDTAHSFADCKKSSYGEGCTAWVIYNENMDYLHCDGLSWNGKKSCK